MFISKEVPIGTINSSNQVFFTTYDISIIDDIFIDGEIYLGTYSIEGKKIILNAAPTETIQVDYYADIITE